MFEVFRETKEQMKSPWWWLLPVNRHDFVTIGRQWQIVAKSIGLTYKELGLIQADFSCESIHPAFPI